MSARIERLRRPAVPTPMTETDKAMEVASIAGLLLNVALAALFWGTMATLFQPDAASDDAVAKAITLVLTTALPAIIYAGMTVASRYVHDFNYPFQVTSNNAAETYGIARTMIRQTKTILIWLMLVSELMFLRPPVAVALGLALIAVIVCGAIGAVLFKALARFRDMQRGVKRGPERPDSGSDRRSAGPATLPQSVQRLLDSPAIPPRIKALYRKKAK